MIKKFISEFIGTMLLVFFGCGTAVALNTYLMTIYSIAYPFTLLPIALAFGLSLVAIVYTIGKVSGAHVNPAVSIACLINGRMTIFECVYYIIAQILGSITGTAILAWMFGTASGLGANGFDTASEIQAIAQVSVTMPIALVVEAILTFVFVLVVLSTTKKENCTSGLAIGLTLALVHIFGIPLTGTSVNPARSIGPAIFVGETALSQVWVFIVGPLIGAIVAALFYRFVLNTEDKPVEAIESADEPASSKKESSTVDATQIDFDFEEDDEDEFDISDEDETEFADDDEDEEIEEEVEETDTDSEDEDEDEEPAKEEKTTKKSSKSKTNKKGKK